MTISRDDLDAGRIVYTDPDIDTAAPRLPPVHPGDVLRHEFMEPLGLTAYRVAQDIAVPTNRISGLMAGKRAMTADTAIRLSAYFGVSAEFWMGLQSGYDLETMRRKLSENGKSGTIMMSGKLYREVERFAVRSDDVRQ